jgi:hypothetical protein
VTTTLPLSEMGTSNSRPDLYPMILAVYYMIDFGMLIDKWWLLLNNRARVEAFTCIIQPYLGSAIQAFTQGQ